MLRRLRCQSLDSRMIFTSPGPELNPEHLRDDLTIPQFILDSQHPLRAHRGANRPWFVDVRNLVPCSVCTKLCIRFVCSSKPPTMKLTFTPHLTSPPTPHSTVPVENTAMKKSEREHLDWRMRYRRFMESVSVLPEFEVEDVDYIVCSFAGENDVGEECYQR